ncbi:outer membrane protein, partial [Novosphingobium pentaromativorans]
MRKLVIGLALASTAIATPAFARDDSWYLELDFGGMIVEDADFDIDGVNNAASLDTHTGYDGGAAIGYDFGGFRLETEASYRRAENDTVSDIDLGTFSDRGHSSMLSFMLNGLLDFGPDDGIQGFVGGGVGVGRVDYRFEGVGSDSDTGFAWQALAGVRAPITKHWDAGLKYRFMNVDNVDVVLGGSDASTR